MLATEAVPCGAVAPHKRRSGTALLRVRVDSQHLHNVQVFFLRGSLFEGKDIAACKVRCREPFGGCTHD